MRATLICILLATSPTTSAIMTHIWACRPGGEPEPVSLVIHVVVSDSYANMVVIVVIIHDNTSCVGHPTGSHPTATVAVVRHVRVAEQKWCIWPCQPIVVHLLTNVPGPTGHRWRRAQCTAGGAVMPRLMSRCQHRQQCGIEISGGTGRGNWMQ